MARQTISDNSRQDQDVIDVRPEQDAALMVLLRGGSDQAAADAAGVTRQTVNVWLHSDPAFVAELNRRRSLVWDAYHDRLRGLVVQALDVLGDQLQGDDPGAARQAASIILKTCGAADLGAGGPISPDRVRLEWASRKVGALEWMAAEY